MTTTSDSAPVISPHPVLIAPSILGADLAHLASELDAIATSDWVHVDVMDGHFVPNLSFGLPICTGVKSASELPMDCHLMIEDPDRWSVGYAEAGAHSVTFHAEVASEPLDIAAALRSNGSEVGLALNPDTPLEPYLHLLEHIDLLLVMTVHPGFGGQSFMPQVLPKVTAAREFATAEGLDLRIQVDGGLDRTSIIPSVRAGADVIVAGSSVYGGSGTAVENIEALRHAAASVS